MLEQRNPHARGEIVKLVFQKERANELLEFLVAHGAVRAPK